MLEWRATLIPLSTFTRGHIAAGTVTKGSFGHVLSLEFCSPFSIQMFFFHDLPPACTCTQHLTPNKLSNIIK